MRSIILRTQGACMSVRLLSECVGVEEEGGSEGGRERARERECVRERERERARASSAVCRT